MNEQEKSYMREALRLAKENITDGKGGPFGAVIVRNGTIIAHAANAVVRTNDPTAHGEIVAIRQACNMLGTFHLDDCELYTSCEPCPMCMGAIYWARIPRVYFAASGEDAHSAGFDDVAFYEQIALPYPEQKTEVRQILRDEAVHIFEEWNNSQNKQEY
ncbi:MAG: nucleoside deaminase [Bacteroidales bacterium]|nr:nucleoside deaminase [Bacteroidales bacterium]